MEEEDGVVETRHKWRRGEIEEAVREIFSNTRQIIHGICGMPYPKFRQKIKM